jgi:hypothetical protein
METEMETEAEAEMEAAVVMMRMMEMAVTVKEAAETVQTEQIKGMDGECKGTSVRFLTSPILSHSPPVHMYSPSSPLYHFQGPYL